MNVTIITDCSDPNAKGRQITRLSSLFSGNVSFIEISNDIEASGNLIDVLDAYENRDGIVLVNIAPRNGEAKKWSNGSPFGYFWYKNILVISTTNGFTLSLVKKLKLIDKINVLDSEKTINKLIHENIMEEDAKEYIKNTQFRSYELLPKIALYLKNKKNIESEELNISEIEDIPDIVWWIDNFGNCKTTILETETSENKYIDTNFGKIKYFKKLKDVPENEIAIVSGSSGFLNKKFLEIVKQGGDASKELNISVGDKIF